MSVDNKYGLTYLGYANTSHQELPFLIHAKTYVPYLIGRSGHTIIAVELKKFGWNIKLVKNKNECYLIAGKNKQKWFIRIITTDTRMLEALRNVKYYINKELEIMADENDALPVIAIVTSDSAVFLSSKTLVGLSLV